MNHDDLGSDKRGMIDVAIDEDADDRRLMGRIATGDRASFERLYRRYVTRVHAYVRTVAGEADPDDIVAETMVAVWRSAGRYGGRSRVATWILAIAHHRAIDALRRKRIDAGNVDDEHDLRATDAASDPVAAALHTARVAELEAALATLSPQHRAVVQLLYAFDYTHAEIATIVNAPVATVKTRVFHAKRKLREALERLDHEGQR